MLLRLIGSQLKDKLGQFIVILILLVFLFSLLGYALHRLPLIEEKKIEAQTAIKVEGFLLPQSKNQPLDWSPVYVFVDGDLVPFVKDLLICSYVFYKQDSVLVGGEPYILPEGMKEHLRLYGITDLEATARLAATKDKITWRSPQSEEMFSSEDLTELLIPKGLEASLPEDAETLTISISPSRAYIASVDTDAKPQPVTFQIAGSYEAQTGPLYCSWKALREQWHTWYPGMPFNTDSLSFTVVNNLKIEELREEGDRYFHPDTGMLRAEMIIQDANYLEQIDSLERHQGYIEVLFPVLIVTSLLVGIVSSLLLQLSRRRQMVLMRTLGTPSETIFLISNLESLSLLFIAFIIALLILIVANVDLDPRRTAISALLGLIYLVGSNISLVFVKNKSLILEVKKEMNDE